MARRHRYRIKDRRRLMGCLMLPLIVIVLAVPVYFIFHWMTAKSEDVAAPTGVIPTLTSGASPTQAATPTPTATPSQVIRITLTDTSSTVNVRKQPSITSEIFVEATHGATYPYLGESDGWWIVSYQGQTAYISETFGVLETAGETPTATP